MFIGRDVWVEDAGLEVYLRWLKRVVGWEDEEEVEFAALMKMLVKRYKIGGG